LEIFIETNFETTPIRHFALIIMHQSPLDFHLPSVPGYTILRKLGQRTFGRVFLAREPRTSQLCALKQIKNTQLGSAQAEAEKLSRLTHPNIVKYLGSVTTSRFFYLAMEFVDVAESSADVYEYLKTRRGRLSEDEIRNIFVQI
jgi:serine/threonine protein kinase